MMTSSDLIGKFKQALEESWGYIWGTAGILWDEARQREKTRHMEQKYGSRWKTNAEAKKDDYYNAALYGGKWIGRKVADCSGLFRWAFRELGGSIAHGSNSIWNSYCREKGWLKDGKRADGKALLPGTAVFTDRDGDKTHIGLYIGGGQVIEASGTIGGVLKTRITLSKWKCWGELKHISYTLPAEDTAEIPPTLRKGNIGPAVEACQQALIRLGYDVGPEGADGDFGRNTEKAVRDFQRDHGLTVDGIIGPKTREALDRTRTDPGGKTYSVLISGLDLTQARALSGHYPATSRILEQENETI